MKQSVKIFMGTSCVLLAACSTQEPKPGLEPLTTGDEVSVLKTEPDKSSQRPPKSIVKNGKTLNLVRIMDGGICKNDYQGVKGEFLVFADAQDIERIKAKKGPKIFSEFEVKIQDLSTAALENAVDAVNLAEDPFALGADEMQQKLSKQLNQQFRSFISAPIKKFVAETTLNIDVTPYLPSLVIFQHGCEASEVEAE